MCIEAKWQHCSLSIKLFNYVSQMIIQMNILYICRNVISCFYNYLICRWVWENRDVDLC